MFSTSYDYEYQTEQANHIRDFVIDTNPIGRASAFYNN